MRVVTLNPPFMPHYSREQRSPAVTKGGTFYYPYWLAYATGVLEKEGFDVRLVDAPAEGWDLRKTLRLVEDFGPSLVVVNTSTPSIYNDVRVSAAIKETLKDAFVVLVGNHVTALPKETLELDTAIDGVARGEYDYVVRDLALSLAGRNGGFEGVKGLTWRDKGGEVVTNTDAGTVQDLDALPFVSDVYRRHLNITNYYFAPCDYPMLMVQTGRGCPWECTWCVYPQVLHARSYRFRSPENVVDEFEYIKTALPRVREISIEDDTFTANPKRVREICELILRRNLKIKWYCNARAHVDKKTMRLMKRAGCRLLIVGFESGNQDILDKMKKGVRLETVRRFVQEAKETGLLIHGCFTFGNPGDTWDTMRQTFAFAKEVDCDSAQFYPMYVYPGTEAYEWAKEQGHLLTEDYSRWLGPDGSHNFVVSTPEFSAAEVVRFCETAYFKYHFRPGYLMYKLAQLVTRPDEGRRSVRNALKYGRYNARKLMYGIVGGGAG